MLHRDVDIFDLDGRHLAGWLSLLLPPSLTGGAAAPPRVMLLFLGDEGRPRHAVVSGDGAIDIETLAFSGHGPRELGALRRAAGVDLVIVLSPGAVGEIVGEIERDLRLGDDYAAQVITVLAALRRASGRVVWMDPPLLELVPPLSADAIQKTFELLVPSSSALVAYVIDERGARDVVASVIAVVEKGEVTVLTTHAGIEDVLPGPTLARAWRSELRRALSFVGERYATPSIGVFVEAAAWRRVMIGPSDQLMREMASGHIIVEPSPTWLRGLLGGAQLASMAGGAARSLARFVPESARRAASAAAGAAQERLKASGAHPFALLGFDPVQLWHRIRTYYRS